MIEIVDNPPEVRLSDYEAVPGLGSTIVEVRRESRQAQKRIGDRRIWVLSEAGVTGAEVAMMPSVIALMRACGVDVRWVQFRPEQPQTAVLCRRLRRLILGDEGVANSFDDDEVALFANEGRAAADAISPLMHRRDILLVHGLSVAPVGAIIKQKQPIIAIWRSFDGLDVRTPATRAAWHFLREHLTPYDRGLFTCAEYIPQYFTNRASLVLPALDPLALRNQPLSLHRIVDILCSAGLVARQQPTLSADFEYQARKVTKDGSLKQVAGLELLFCPIVTQISRWDRLKGQRPLLEGFVELKQQLKTGRLRHLSSREQRRIDQVHLIIAGPDPASFGDDSDSQAMFDEMVGSYCELPPEISSQVHIITLPTESAQEHALLINALHRISTVMVQNTLRDGFNLTVTEAAWKGVPVLGSGASGVRLQIRHEIDGLLCDDPEDPTEVARYLKKMLKKEQARRLYAVSAQRRVLSEFLITSQLRRLLRLLTELA